MKIEAGYKKALLHGMTSFFNEISAFMINSVLPFFIVQLGGGGISIGLLAGIREFFASSVKVLGGYLSAKSGKYRWIIVSGYTFSNVFKILLSFANNYIMAIILSGGERVGKGLRSGPKDAVVSEAIVGRGGLSFGIVRSLDRLGAVIGSGIAITMLTYGYLADSIIFYAGILGFLCLIPLLNIEIKDGEPKEPKNIMNFSLLSQDMKRILAVVGVFNLGFIPYVFMVLYVANFIPGIGGKTLAIFAFMIFTFVHALSGIPSGILADRYGRKLMILLGYIVFMLVCVGFFFITSKIGFVILFILLGFANAFIDGNEKALIGDICPKDIKGAIMGIYGFVTGVAYLIGSVICGYMWNHDPKTMFAYGIITTIVAFFMLIFMISPDKVLSKR